MDSPLAYVNANLDFRVNLLIDQYGLPSELKENMNKKTKGLFVQEGMLAIKITYEDVPIDTLRAMQQKIYLNKLDTAIQCGDNCFPILVQRYRSKGKVYHAIYDGHHRALEAYLKGKPKIKSIVMDIGSLRPSGINWSLQDYWAKAPREKVGTDSPYCRLL